MASPKIFGTREVCKDYSLSTALPTASLEMISVVSVFSDALGDHMFVNDVSEQKVFSWRKTLFLRYKVSTDSILTTWVLSLHT